MSDVSNRQDRKAATPSRRPSVSHGQLSCSPHAGNTVVFRPSPTQSPAAAQTHVVIGNAGTIIGTMVGAGSAVATSQQLQPTAGGGGIEFNTTQIGSNNISLQNKVRKLWLLIKCVVVDSFLCMKSSLYSHLWLILF